MIFPTTDFPNQAPKKCCLKQYFDHETQDTMTALHLFCRWGPRHRSDIKTIVHLQPQLISFQTSIGRDTPLHFAVAAHDLETTCLLLHTNPAAANIKSGRSGNFGDQMTPLHVAVASNASFEMIKALVQASPRSLKLRSGNGETPYKMAARLHETRKDMEQIVHYVQHHHHHNTTTNSRQHQAPRQDFSGSPAAA